MMRTPKTVGRTMGILMLVQGVTGYTVNFVLLAPAISAPPGFLGNAAAHHTQVSLAVLLMIALGALSIFNMILAWPIFRRYSSRMALALVAISIAGFTLAAVEGASIMSMLSLSQEYAKGDPAKVEIIEAMATVVRFSRNWAHYTHLLVGGGLVFLLHATLFRFALVPRVLTGFGMAAALLQMTAISMPFFGRPIIFLLLAPLGLAHLALALWLLAKGFADRRNGIEQNHHD